MALPQYLTLDQMLKQTPANRADMAAMLTRFRRSPFLDSLSFENRPGQAFMQWTETTDLPSAAARGLNENFTPSQGRTEPNFAPFKVYGGEMQQDVASDKMGLSDPLAENARMARSLRLTLEYDAIFADPTSTPKTITGTQYLAENSGDAASTSISAGATANGAALSVFALRNAIDECVDPEKIVLSQKLLNRLTGGAEATGVAGYITYQKGDFGRRLAFFDGLPLVPMERTTANARILDFTEAAATGTPTATSLYVTGRGYRWGQNGPPDLTPLARSTSQQKREMMWILANKASRYSVIRLKHIGNLAVVA